MNKITLYENSKEVILYDKIFSIENSDCNEIVKILGIKIYDLHNYNDYEKKETSISKTRDELFSDYLSCYKQLIDGFFIIDDINIDKDKLIYNKCKINNYGVSFGSLLIDTSSIPLKDNNMFNIINTISFSTIKKIYNIIINNNRNRNSNLFIKIDNFTTIIILIDDNIIIDYTLHIAIYFIRKEFLVLIYDNILSY